MLKLSLLLMAIAAPPGGPALTPSPAPPASGVSNTHDWHWTAKLDGTTGFIWGWKDAQGFVHEEVRPVATSPTNEAPVVNFGVPWPLTPSVGDSVLGTDAAAAKLILAKPKAQPGPSVKQAEPIKVGQCDVGGWGKKPCPPPDPLEQIGFQLQPWHIIGILIGLFMVFVATVLLLCAGLWIWRKLNPLQTPVAAPAPPPSYPPGPTP